MVATTSPTRLDLALVDRGLAPTRQRAQALIAAGMIEIDGTKARSSARRTVPGEAIRILGHDHPWVGRGGIKLAAALEAFAVDCADRVALDAGASTGGFTDVLLTNGASLVYAVDVGHGQLVTRIAEHPRVRVMDRTNLRTLETLPGPAPSLVTLDLAFISLRVVLPAVSRLAPGAEIVALFKPQFELGRDAVGRGGVVADRRAAEAGARQFLDWATATLGAEARFAPVRAPIRGAKGNQEWLTHLQLPPPPGGAVG